MPLTVKPRVVSLLPSATDIMAALGAGDLLVGVSHSCDGHWANLPVLTSTLIEKNAPAGDIDAQVKNSSGPLYELDIARLEALAPDIVISQDLCDVCAVPSGDVDDALKSLPTAPELVTLAPFRLADIPVCFEQVGQVIGQMAAAESLQARWAEALMACRGRFAEHDYRIAFLDWLDPPFAAGHWVPDIISWIGCTSVLAQSGEPSHEISWSKVRDCGADFIFAACCGQSVETAKTAVENLPADLDIHILDGAKHFSRPSPTIMESVGYFADTIAALSR